MISTIHDVCESCAVPAWVFYTSTQYSSAGTMLVGFGLVGGFEKIIAFPALRGKESALD
jgi:hypothetical protein